LPLKVYITTYFEKDRVTISVKNSGKWVDSISENSSGTNTGIANVKERLNCEYDDKCSFEIISSDEFVEVKLEFLNNI
jgi:LytS/YehU family sensor histidine kinase